MIEIVCFHSYLLYGNGSLLCSNHSIITCTPKIHYVVWAWHCSEYFIWDIQSHMNAPEKKSPARGIWLWNTAPTICLYFNKDNRGAVCHVRTQIEIFRHFCHAPLAVGMVQVAFGKAVIAPRCRCPSGLANSAGLPSSLWEDVSKYLSPPWSHRMPECQTRL